MSLEWDIAKHVLEMEQDDLFWEKVDYYLQNPDDLEGLYEEMRESLLERIRDADAAELLGMIQDPRDFVAQFMARRSSKC